MAYALGVGQTDRRNRNESPSQASGLTTGAGLGGGQPTAANNQGLQKRVGTSQAPGTANTSSKGAEDFTKSNFANTQAIIDRNQGADQTGITNKITSDAQNQANKQLSDINQRSTDYTANQNKKTQDYAGNVTDADIQGAVEGDQAATGRVNTALHLQPGQVDEFDAGTYDPIKANEYLRNGDITSVLMGRGTQNYSSGMAALDNLMFGKAGGFEDVGKKVQDLQSGVSNAYGAATNKDTGVKSQAQLQREKAVKDVIAKARTGLSDQEQGILSGAAGRLATAQQALPGQIEAQKAPLRAQVTKKFDDQIADIQRRIAEDPSQTVPGMEAIAKIQQAKQNPDQYLSVTNPTYTQDSFLDQGNADALNRIHQLLGIGGPAAVAGSAQGPSASIRDQDLNYILSQITNPANESMNQASAANKSAQEAANVAKTQQQVQDLTSNNPYSIAPNAPRTVDPFEIINPTRKPRGFEGVDMSFGRSGASTPSFGF